MTIKFTTLWEILMKEFDPEQLILMGLIHGMRGITGIEREDDNISQELKEDWLHDAEAAETLCCRLGLTLSQMANFRFHL